MAVCQDPRLTYMNDLGYNVVRLPRTGIKPLGVLGRDNKTINYLGTLDQIWNTTATPPSPGAPNSVSALAGQATSDIKLSVGLDILANALSGMFGAAAPSLKFAYNKAKSVQFKFGEVQTVGIDPFIVGNYLASGDLKDGNAFVARFFHAPETEAFVITEILQAKSISVTAKADSGGDVGVDVPAIQSTLGGKVNVTTSSSSNTDVTYTGNEYLTFGFKVFGIAIIDGTWQVHGVPPSGDVSFAPGTQIEPVLLSRSGRLDLALADAK
jgi:hypothetical protein